ncbi:MAG: hypothetical protein ING89_14635 [Rubrivivax sp.]|jgi:hypothetical protein|nr:hypothetical protein [Rubrivivax sp.]
MPPHLPPPPLRLLERPPIRQGAPARSTVPTAPWWTAGGLKRVWRSLGLPA